MTQYAAAVTFADQAKAYQALSELRRSSAAEVVASAALVQRTEDGHLTVPEGGDSAEGVGFAGGTLVGMLVGVLGGPLGMLLGMGTGALVGSLFDLDRAETGDSALEAFGQAVKPGTNALILETNEPDTTALDAFVSAQGGTIVRRPLDEVVDELESQQAAAEAAAEAARKKMREERRAERKEKVEDRIENLKKKFHRDSATDGANS